MIEAPHAAATDVPTEEIDPASAATGPTTIDIEHAFVRFICSDEMYAMSLTSIREVVPAGPFSRVPKAPISTVGLMNHGGRVYTVVDLAAFLGSGEGRPRDQVLLLDDPMRSLGIAVDKVEGIGPIQLHDAIGRFGDRAVAVIGLDDLASDIDAAFESASVVVFPKLASSPKER